MKSLSFRLEFLLGLLFHHQCLASPGDLDPSFDAGSGLDGEIRAMVVQPDGMIVIGGDFHTVKGFVKHGIARLTADGSNDATFNAGASTNEYLTVDAIALQADGKILIGGAFDIIDGIGRTNIARLNPDGTVDNTFNPGPSSSLNAIALQSDGKVLIGGYFTEVNGFTRNYLARLNPDGSLDKGFNPATTSAVGHVDCIAVQPDGKVLFGSSYGRMGRLNSDGSRDTGFNVSVAGVVSIALQPDGKVLIGGGNGYVNNILTGGFARLNANGSLDTNFNLGDPSLFYPNVNSISIQADGKILAGGSSGAVIRSPMNRFNPDGTLDASFDPNVLTRGDRRQESLNIAVQPDGKLIIAGDFKTVGGVSRYRIARINPDGSLDESFNAGSGVDDGVGAIAAQPDGKIIIGGSFDGVGGLIRSCIARLNTNGSLDASFDPQLFPYPVSSSDPNFYVEPSVSAITLQPDGKILVGSVSLIVTIQGLNDRAWDLARLNPDGNLDASFNPVHGTHQPDSSGIRPVCVALQADGRILLGSNFDSLNGAPISCIARLAPDGNLDASFNADVRHDVPNFYPSVRSMALQPGGKVIIAGSFTTVDGVSRTNLARLNTDGSLDLNFDSSFGTNGISTMVAQPDGKLLVLDFYGQRFARLNADGSLDTSFNPETINAVAAIALQPDGKVIIGGDFVTVNGISRKHLARLNADGSLDASFNPADGVDGSVTVMALQPDGRLLIGGGFASVSGIARNYLARVLGDSTILTFQELNNKLVLSWTNAGFTLQSAPAAIGPFTNLPAASSPYTNPITAPQRFFRLVQ